MKLSEIIRKESDRIFVVDPECFIVFTGDSLTDERPFIRIGNWHDLPVEIIPLIENIIISDLYIGNPAYEQFNIDVKYLPKNRYIGRNQIINKFLNYQKIFGLNLGNANFIDAEKDIPAISKSGIISDRESFIGIFYKDGNFKIEHNGHDLLNLRDLTDEIQNEYVTHDIICKNSKKTNRYSGSGFSLIDNNPVFYHANSFIPYLFPRAYSIQFTNLGISPRNIAAVVHPSSNFMGITRFLKWKHLSQGKITLFTDYSEKIRHVKNLFPDITMKIDKFSGMAFNEIRGFSVKNIHGSFNLQIESVTENDKISYVYIKALGGLEDAIRIPHDFILVNYSVFEDASMLLNQQKKPVLIHDDGNINIKKIGRLKNIIILQNIQYEAVKHSDEKNIHKVFKNLLSQDILSCLENGEYDRLKTIKSDGIETFNILSYLQLQYSTTSNRSKSEQIRKIIPSLKYSLEDVSDSIVITLHISGDTLFQSAARLDKPSADFAVPDILSDDNIKTYSSYPFIKRIETDRKRLRALLSLYSNSTAYRNEIRELKNAINERKKIFSQEFLSKEAAETLNLDNLFESPEIFNHENAASASVAGKIISLFTKSGKDNYGQYHSSTDSMPDYKVKAAGDETTSRMQDRQENSGKSLSYSAATSSRDDHQIHHDTFQHLRKTKQFFISLSLRKITSILIFLTVLIFLLFLSNNAYNKYKTEKAIRIEEENARQKAEQERQEKEELEKKKAELKKFYSIKVSNQDIFLYANEIAVKNGYDPFPNTEFKHRNPNWIFPDNKFVFPDGQIVTVVSGDTLWALCEKKLMEIYYQYYEIVRRIETSVKNTGKYDPEDLKKAEELIHTPRQKKEFAKLISTLKTDDTN